MVGSAASTGRPIAGGSPLSRVWRTASIQLSIVDRETMKMRPITTARLNSFSPAWSSDKKWLYFVSERNLHTLVTSPWGPRQPEPYYTETRNFYAMPLDSTARFPFLTTDSWLTDSLFTPGAATASPQTRDIALLRLGTDPKEAIRAPAEKRQPRRSANRGWMVVLAGLRTCR